MNLKVIIEFFFKRLPQYLYVFFYMCFWMNNEFKPIVSFIITKFAWKI